MGVGRLPKSLLATSNLNPRGQSASSTEIHLRKQHTLHCSGVSVLSSGSVAPISSRYICAAIKYKRYNIGL